MQSRLQHGPTNTHCVRHTVLSRWDLLHADRLLEIVMEPRSDSLLEKNLVMNQSAIVVIAVYVANAADGRWLERSARQRESAQQPARPLGHACSSEALRPCAHPTELITGVWALHQTPMRQ